VTSFAFSLDIRLSFVQDEIEYRTRYRPLKIRLLDGTVKTILIDDSLIVAQLMVYICTKFGIANHDEYSLVYDLNVDHTNQNTKTATLRRVTIAARNEFQPRVSFLSG
jgi:hypothetical protein